ncbi:MAG: NAD+ synthase [Thermoplasmata archaeon]|nr:NAD+ synthase [Thermoplasmata archaeon]
MSDLRPRLPPHAKATLVSFLKAHVKEAGARGVVLGLSGGIDSAVAARLSIDALGTKGVTGVLLPDASYPKELLEETLGFARDLGIESVIRSIVGPEEALRTLLGGQPDPTAWGNVKARIRMTILYAEARARDALVLGTGNKSELLTGYFTKYGDGGADLLPLGDLYKTEIRELANELHIPDPIRSRPPTAGLWEGQTDEGELGLPYDQLDRILRGAEELQDPKSIAKIVGLPEATVREVIKRIGRNRHKRRLPPIPKLSLRTIGVDWRD